MSVASREQIRAVEAACAADDKQRLRELGWLGVYDALRVGWTKRFPLADFAIYVRLLEGKDPAKIEDQVIRMAPDHPKWRPTPAEVLGGMKALAAPAEGGPRQRKLRRDQEATAYLAVLQAVAAGEEVCACFPFAGHVLEDQDGVHRCAECDRLELGQYESAVEWDTAT